MDEGEFENLTTADEALIEENARLKMVLARTNTAIMHRTEQKIWARWMAKLLAPTVVITPAMTYNIWAITENQTYTSFAFWLTLFSTFGLNLLLGHSEFYGYLAPTRPTRPKPTNWPL
jgi:hypothetical protein